MLDYIPKSSRVPGKTVGAVTKDAPGALFNKFKAQQISSKMKKAAPRMRPQPLKSNIANSTIPSYKKGGMVKKTGLAKLHKGEKVIPKSKVKKRRSKK